MKLVLAMGMVLACAACAAATPDAVKPERISRYEFRDSTCRELVSTIRSGREDEARLVEQMNVWPTTGGGMFVRRADIGRKLANVRGQLKAAKAMSDRARCEERLRYVGQ